jgi:hypothetical protein
VRSLDPQCHSAATSSGTGQNIPLSYSATPAGFPAHYFKSVKSTITEGLEKQAPWNTGNCPAEGKSGRPRQLHQRRMALVLRCCSRAPSARVDMEPLTSSRAQRRSHHVPDVAQGAVLVNGIRYGRIRWNLRRLTRVRSGGCLCRATKMGYCCSGTLGIRSGSLNFVLSP